MTFGDVSSTATPSSTPVPFVPVIFSYAVKAQLRITGLDAIFQRLLAENATLVSVAVQTDAADLLQTQWVSAVAVTMGSIIAAFTVSAESDGAAQRYHSVLTGLGHNASWLRQFTQQYVAEATESESTVAEFPLSIAAAAAEIVSSETGTTTPPPNVALIAVIVVVVVVTVGAAVVCCMKASEMKVKRARTATLSALHRRPGNVVPSDSIEPIKPAKPGTA